MHTDESGTRSQPSEGDQGQSQGSGAITGMLKGSISSLGDTLRDLVRSEVALAKTELKEEATQAGKAGGMIAGGGILGLTGFMFLMTGLMHLLAKKLPMWASATLVGSALVAIAGLLGMSGKNQLQETQVKPDQTIGSLRDVKDTLSDAAQT